MKKTFGLILSLTGAALSAGDITIAEKGKAAADIVIPAEPSAYVRFAAGELKYYLDKMSGGDFKITDSPLSPVKIHLGKSPAAAAMGLNPESLKEDSFFISAGGNDIFIVGDDNPAAEKVSLFHMFHDEPRRGTILGVYDFLESLGARWPAPGAENEFVPWKDSLKIPEGTQKREPFFQDRMFSSGFWNFMTAYPDAKEYVKSSDDMYLWGLRLKHSTRLMLVGCHSERSLELKTLWGGKSEHAALINGERNGNYSCWTDPAVIEVWKKAADVYFSGGKPAEAGLPHLKPYLGSSWPWPFINPDEFMIDPMDHYTGCDGRCRCDRCNEFRKKHPCDDDTELLWSAISEVAVHVKEKHPGKFITTLVYPPKQGFPKYVKIPDNVRVRVCIRGPVNIPTPNLMSADTESVRVWGKALGVNPPLWTYQCEAAFGRKLPGVPETYPRLIAGFLHALRGDIAGMYMESDALSHTCRNMDMYITMRLLWNPDQNVDALLDDYFKVYYGPAAGPVKTLFKRFEDNWIKYWKMAVPDKAVSGHLGVSGNAKELQKLVWSKVYNPPELQNLDKMLAGAERAAAGSPAHAKRVKLLRTWIFDIMKAERAEVMDKAEARQKINVAAPETKTTPTADAWTAVPPVPFISAERLKPELSAGGQFKLLRFDNTLFVRAELTEPSLSASLTKKDRKTGDKEVWKDNDIEIFIFSENSKDLWQIIINDQGAWASQKLNTGKSEWTQLDGVNVNVSRQSDGWNVEAAVPLEKLGDGNLRFNITRNRQIKGQPNELSTWSSLAKLGNWHDPDCYGNLLFDKK
jgi:hypothetical protein